MRLAIGQTARNRGADSGRFRGVETVHVETHVQPFAMGEALECLPRHNRQPALVDLAHREGLDVEFADEVARAGIDVAEAEKDDVSRVELRFWSAYRRHLSGSAAEKRSQRHAVEIAAG
jgi:hypothetical protein